MDYVVSDKVDCFVSESGSDVAKVIPMDKFM